KPVAGDTVLVSGAAGATGSIVGQLAKLAGCRVVGIAGGPDKCKWLVDEAGYDAAIDYKAGNVKAQIKEHCPTGVDVIFDNVGGVILDDMLANIATAARVVICGGISRYESGGKPVGPGNYFNLIFRRASMQGFIVLDWAAEFPVLRKRLEGFVKDGSLKYQEDIQEGFENAPDTLQRLFVGKNRGKQMLKL
ncbi:MAG: NADP-dependent oxidoreductase, partial [Marinomonas sp.]